VIVLHAIVRSPADAPDGAHALAIGGVAAVVTRPSELSPPEPEALWAHERLVESIASAAVLPARFGTVVDDEAALHRLLAANEAVLLQALEHVAGCVEVSVRMWARSAMAVASGGTTSAAVGPGRAYLQERREALHAPRAAAEATHARLAEVARDAVERRGARQEVLVGAYLVPRGDLGAFRDAVAEEDRDLGELDLLSTGPWPPYHFTPRLEVPR
jgi:hypothetical protein